jgi:hypothetical protein
VSAEENHVFQAIQTDGTHCLKKKKTCNGKSAMIGKRRRHDTTIDINLMRVSTDRSRRFSPMSTFGQKRLLSTHLFFDVLQLLLQLLYVVAVVGVSASVVHQRALVLRRFARRRFRFLLDVGLHLGDGAQTAAAHRQRYHQFDLRTAHDALFHDLGAALAGAHVAARFEQHRRLLIGTDQTFLDLEKERRSEEVRARWIIKP